jgi:hypothetical protein
MLSADAWCNSIVEGGPTITCTASPWGNGKGKGKGAGNPNGPAGAAALPLRDTGTKLLLAGPDVDAVDAAAPPSLTAMTSPSSMLPMALLDDSTNCSRAPSRSISLHVRHGMT